MYNLQFLVKGLSGQTRCLNFQVENEVTTISTLQIKEKIQELEGIKIEDQRLIANTKELSDKFLFSPIPNESNNALTFILSLSSRLMGGKGGFGALLRGAGTKMGKRKFNNNDDCRDLNGRRLKHVKAEKELLEWIAQKKNEGTEKKKEEKKKPTEPQHQFDGTGYFNELEEITDSVTSSVEKGLHSSKQNKSVAEPQKKKRRTVWGEMDDLFEDDGSSDEVENQEPKTKDPVVDGKEENEKSTQKSEVKEEKLEPQIEKKEEPKEEEDDMNVIYKEIQKEVSKYSNAEELQTLGLEKLKELLSKIGFKSGGTLVERSIRLFTIKDVDYDKLDQKLFAKPTKRNGKK